MFYKWLVIWWTVTVVQGGHAEAGWSEYTPDHFDGNSLGHRMNGLGRGYRETKHNALVFEETRRVGELHFNVFAEKKDADEWISTFNTQAYSGNEKIKFQTIELKPQIEMQRPDASPEQKKMLEGK